MKLRWPISSKKDKMASHNPSFEKDAIVIQSFLRGALCRARVNRMVQKLIDDILLKRKNAAISSRTIEDDDDDSSINVIDDEHNNNNNNNEMDGSSISIDVLDIPLPKNIKDSSKKEPNEDMQESVSDILLKIEANSPKSNKPPNWNFPPVKRSEKPKVNTDQKFPTGIPSPIDPTQTDTQKKICFVKDANLLSNASKRQTDTEKFLQEHEIRMKEEMQQLLTDIKRIGESGEPYVEFGDLFDDEEVADYYEALVGTLKAAKKKGLINYEGQFLLKGFTNTVIISIV